MSCSTQVPTAAKAACTSVANSGTGNSICERQILGEWYSQSVCSTSVLLSAFICCHSFMYPYRGGLTGYVVAAIVISWPVMDAMEAGLKVASAYNVRVSSPCIIIYEQLAVLFCAQEGGWEARLHYLLTSFVLWKGREGFVFVPLVISSYRDNRPAALLKTTTLCTEVLPMFTRRILRNIVEGVRAGHKKPQKVLRE